MLEQAETKAFPPSSLLDELRVVTAEADKVAVMAQQLLNGKRQTRYLMDSPLVWFELKLNSCHMTS